jgi:Mg-chelatase subunit ChlD
MQPLADPTTTTHAVRELHYRSAAPARGHFPGHHRSTRGTNGFEFRAHAALFDAPDVRRLDLHASLRDPFGAWRVRVYNERVSMPVAIVADLSASMGFVGAAARREVLADFTESLALSAWRTGDSFGFVGCDEVVRSDWLLPATRARGAGGLLAHRLREAPLEGRSAQALASAHRHLSRQRALVFLLSDFHLPITEIDAAIASLAHHDLVPTVIWDAREFELSATRGLANVVDPETGRQRWLWWRPALRARWQAAHEARREALLQVFRSHRLRPLFILGAFDADAVTRHFFT